MVVLTRKTALAASGDITHSPATRRPPTADRGTGNAGLRNHGEQQAQQADQSGGGAGHPDADGEA